jgi:hypothetical protein
MGSQRLVSGESRIGSGWIFIINLREFPLKIKGIPDLLSLSNPASYGQHHRKGKLIRNYNDANILIELQEG